MIGSVPGAGPLVDAAGVPLMGGREAGGLSPVGLAVAPEGVEATGVAADVTGEGIGPSRGGVADTVGATAGGCFAGLWALDPGARAVSKPRGDATGRDGAGEATGEATGAAEGAEIASGNLEASGAGAGCGCAS